MLAAFLLSSMPMKANFLSALSKVILDGHLELLSVVQFRIMDDRNCFKLWVI